MPSEGNDSDFRRVLYGILNELSTVACAIMSAVDELKISTWIEGAVNYSRFATKPSEGGLLFGADLLLGSDETNCWKLSLTGCREGASECRMAW